MITNNEFTHNFGKLYALNILIYKLGFTFYKNNCTGVYIDSNTFESNYGCDNAQGNVVVSCEMNNQISMFSGGPTM
jgi:hypothetical protein